MKFLTKKPILSVVAQAIMCGLVLSGCQGDENGVDFGKANQSDDKSVFDNGRRKTAEVDIEKECGLPPGAIANKSAVILQENLKSLPIVVSGSQMGTDFKVTTVANAQITGTTSSSTQVLNVDVTDTQAAGMTALFGQFLVKSKAKDAAAENSGRKTYNSLPQGEWLTLTNGSNPEFSNLLCAVTATKTVENHLGKKVGHVSFAPALINSINPKAPKETLDKEIGSGRTFSITATVDQAKDGWATGQVQGKVSIRSVSPQINIPGQNISADVAYEITADFPKGAVSVGVSRKQTFYINTTTHTFEAIVDDSGAIDSNTKTELPPTVLIRQQ